ncbi:MAG: hypothetical protein ACTSXO_10975 [Candidatus Heimdallarchaeota archaeon]
MKRHRRVIGLTMFLVFLLWAKTYPATSKVQTYVIKGGLKSSQKFERSELLVAQQMEDTIRVEKADSIKLKDPNYAIFVALVPGAVVHGAGHFYAGKVGRGLILFGCELVGAGLFYLGGVTGIETGELSSGGTVAVATGVTLFFGSWAYDLVFAPLAIKKHNEELLQSKSPQIKLGLYKDNRQVRIVMIKHF